MTPLDKEEVLIKKLRDSFRHDIIETTIFKGEITHLVEIKALRAICNFLKTDPELRMNFLADISGVDYYGAAPRFEVVYHFYSIPKKHRIRIKVKAGEGETVPSITSIWPGADWPEREAYDMFGIVFEGHPDLKRIYLANDWEGFPLRKDYPLRGYKDRYNPYGEEKPEEI
ncbi:MAG: NADH-quinone oxidoreductase subunit C [Deltaproteobacteria bacterium]|nr:NADH-quinone oxidoreductase subunit C [Deltaproteobacteria bacterium]